MYYLAKLSHLILVFTSVVLLSIRFISRMIGSRFFEKGAPRVIPHVIDTGLLLTAVWLCVLLNYNPFVVGWLMEKIVLICCYIGFGALALHYGTALGRFLAMLAALGCIAVIVHLATTKQAFLLG